MPRFALLVPPVYATRLSVCVLTGALLLSWGCSEPTEQYRYSKQALQPTAEQLAPDTAELATQTEPEAVAEAADPFADIELPEHHSELYSHEVARISHLLIKPIDTQEDTLDVDAAIYNKPQGKNLGILSCTKLPGCNDYVMDIAQQNVAVYEVVEKNQTTWARISEVESVWAKVQAPLKLVSFEQVGQLVEAPRQAMIVCVAPGVGCSELSASASDALRVFKAAQLNAINKIILLAINNPSEAENFAGLEEAATLFGYEPAKVKTVEGYHYVSFELPSLREITQALDSVNNKTLRPVSMRLLATRHPTEYNAYVQAKERYQQILGRKYMWIRTRDAHNIPTVYAKTGE